jgi:hypothetical protein
MNVNTTKLMAAVALLAASTLACGLLSRPAESTSAAPTAADAGNSAPLFKDDLTDASNWEQQNDPDYVIDQAGGALRIKVWTAQEFTWSNLLNRNFQDIHIETTVKDASTDDSHSFGLVCDQQSSGGKAQIAHYWLGLDPSGYYEIGKRVVGKDDVVLTGNGDWAASDAFPKKAQSYQLGADCGHGTLTLYVNGTKIASAQDATYSQGGVGLFVWSGSGSTGPVSFDDVVITALK